MVLIVCLHMSVYSMNTTVGDSEVCHQATERAALCGNIVNPCERMSLFSPERTKFLTQILCPAYLGVSRKQAYPPPRLFVPYSYSACWLSSSDKTFRFKLSFYQLLKPGHLLGLVLVKNLFCIPSYSPQNASQDISGIQKQIQFSRCGLMNTIPDVDYHLFC